MHSLHSTDVLISIILHITLSYKLGWDFEFGSHVRFKFSPSLVLENDVTLGVCWSPL